MKERRQIVALYQDPSGPAPVILVSLVHAEGSSYRRPGAHLLLLENGRHAGTISGGCLEAEVLRKAAWLTRSGATVERYSTLFDDTGEIPYGLGCGGQVDLLLEPANTPECRALVDAFAATLREEHRFAATLLPQAGNVLRRAIWNSAGDLLFASEGLPAHLIAEMHRLAAAATSSGTLELNTQRIFLEPLHPPQRLILFGAGDDAQPLAAMAAQLGWTVIVADSRAQLANAERFSDVSRIAVLRAAEISSLQIQTTDAIVLMTHSYEQDRALLQQLLPIAPRYFGLLGARHRTSLLVSEVAAALGWKLSQCAERLHAPVGLDLGGDAPEAVALAILAEAHAVCHGRNAASRRISAEVLAESMPTAVQAAELRAVCPADFAPQSK